MEEERPGIREHVKNVELGFGSINIIRGSKSAILLPKTLPPRLNFVERVCPPYRLPTILPLNFTQFLSRRVSYTPAHAIPDSISEIAFPYGDCGGGGSGGEFPTTIGGERQRMAMKGRRLKQLNVQLGVQHFGWECGVAEDWSWTEEWR